MDHEPLTQVEREVASWPGISTGDTGRGGLQLSYGKVELGIYTARASLTCPFPREYVTN